jgi:hypothetical protein
MWFSLAQSWFLLAEAQEIAEKKTLQTKVPLNTPHRVMRSRHRFVHQFLLSGRQLTAESHA